jgi:hypothetical protein
MKLLSLASGLAVLALNAACSSETPGTDTGTAGTGNTPGQSGSSSTAGSATGGIPGGGGTPGGGGGNNTAGVTASGSAGSAPVAGAGGSAGSGAGGSAPTAGSGGGGGGSNLGKSAGCGKQEPLQQPPRTYVKHDITVDVAAAYQPAYTSREYHTWLPDNYDPNKAYPLYFWGNGCGVQQGKPEGIPVANIEEVKTGAILVFMIQEDGCFDAGKGGLADTPDVPYFSKMLDDIEANYCIDQGKVFVGGYSSSAWFAATLSCSHGDRINGIAMAAGGQQDELPACTGQSAMILWAGNEGASGNPIDTPPNVAWEGSAAVRDRLIAANGCQMTTTKWDSMWSSCNLYDGCGKNPVVFCPHGGGHDTGAGSQMNSLGFWKLFKSTW